jgi:peroxiredoxin
MRWSVGQDAPEGLLQAEVFDPEGHARVLGDVLEGHVALLVFLRHYGCTGCSQQVDALVPVSQALHDLGVRLVLLGNGQPEHLKAFVERLKLAGYPFELFTDPSRAAYRAVGLTRSLWRVFGPTALAREVLVRTMGYTSTALEGDVLQQGGVGLLDRQGKLRFFAEPEVAAKPVAIERIVDATMSVVAERVGAESLAVV